MSFSPLPKTFLDLLRTSGDERIVELGCADGRFTALMHQAGVRPVCIDHRPPAVGTVADLVADARALPLSAGSIRLLVCANLLRQLWPLPERAPVPADWLHCLREGGDLFIFEDEPAADPPAARNYRDLQTFLSRLDPVGRRPLLSRAVFERALGRAAVGSGRCRIGWRRNRWPADSDRIVRWLLGMDAGQGGEAARLADSIRRDGLCYGSYWWARWSV